MANRIIQAAYERLLKQLPDHFGDTFYELENYKNHEGIIKFTVQGWYDRPYTFAVNLRSIKACFAWLEGILDSPYTESHDYQFFDIKKKRNLVVGYIPITSDGYYHESSVSEDFPEIPLKDCGMYYVYDTEKQKVLESAFVHYEDLARRIYTTIKRCKRLRAKSQKIESYFLGKEDIIYTYKGITCKGSISKGEFRYYGNFFDEDGKQIDHWGIASDYESEFLSHARGTIRKILEYREYRRKNKEWKESNDIESIGCVFDIMPEVFKQRVLDGKFDTSLNDCVKGGDYEVPLPYVTKAWDYLLKGTLCANEFRVEYDPEDGDEPVDRTREEALEQNEQMKVLWKEYFNIDIDALDIDFSTFNKHLPPNANEDEVYYHFQDVPNGIEEWILDGINTPTGGCSFDDVSSLMEFAAYIGIERQSWDEDW